MAPITLAQRKTARRRKSLPKEQEDVPSKQALLRTEDAAAASASSSSSDSEDSASDNDDNDGNVRKEKSSNADRFEPFDDEDIAVDLDDDDDDMDVDADNRSDTELELERMVFGDAQGFREALNLGGKTRKGVEAGGMEVEVEEEVEGLEGMDDAALFMVDEMGAGAAPLAE
ncbi:hypothetical protein LTS18_001512, partial [Coniosporium uncinatum]